MADLDLRGLERRARESGDVEDVQEYCRALMRLGSDYLQSVLGSGRDSWQNLMYRHALKLTGGGQAGLDLRLPHSWSVFSAGVNFGATRVALVRECSNDHGLHPFFDKEARPLTFKETIQARMDQFDQSGGKDWSLWENYFDSCTGIVWEAGARRFKIVPMHPDLLTVQASRAEYLPANFENTPGTPIIVDDKYNRALTPAEVIANRGWLAAVEGDSQLLQRYVATAFGRLGRATAMVFYIPRQGLPDHLRPLCASSLGYDCSCVGIRNMSNLGRFARVRSL